ncbi:terminase small subunit [Providencia rettgeri]|uniref:terminase small subunit n=1 Tax=Providencia rettgeri TaxID=587 RepID=UPI001EE747CD|nr:terminase small subunit [Providencia rettgeri]EMC8779174.1 terminase small subunit [Providencia rettgeri]MCG5369096.1 terminase small subunit [Providencia rettgeri]MCL0008486.1 terminase small subunit [Providencia rettgeri]
MAKPDWGTLQQQFLTEHAISGISPKEWCEDQGLNYATARRYIKKPAAQSAQKTAHKKLRTAQTEDSAKSLSKDKELTQQQKRFVAEYLIDGNATQAAIRAGYSDESYGRQLLTIPHVANEIAHQQQQSLSRTLIKADEVLAKAWSLATFDANELSQYRRGCCRHCWGFGYQYQWRDAVEFEEKRLEAIERKKRAPEDTGGYGYNHTKEPNPLCPRCNGEGIGQPFFPDTRKLNADAALAYSGVKLGKNGVEILSINRERMFDAVMKRLGLADSEAAQRILEIELERRRLEVEKLRKELAENADDDNPTPVAININVVDARADDDITDT